MMITAILIFAATCDPALWAHVYKPQRLTILQGCVTITGTIMHRRHEPDGDWHIQFQPDAGELDPTNARNDAVQHGFLVLEPICIGTVKQKDAKKPCRGTPQITVPTVGEHVRATGSLVLDTSPSHGWIELHPVTFEVVP